MRRANTSKQWLSKLWNQKGAWLRLYSKHIDSTKISIITVLGESILGAQQERKTCYKWQISTSFQSRNCASKMEILVLQEGRTQWGRDHTEAWGPRASCWCTWGLEELTRERMDWAGNSCYYQVRSQGLRRRVLHLNSSSIRMQRTSGECWPHPNNDKD